MLRVRPVNQPGLGGGAAGKGILASHCDPEPRAGEKSPAPRREVEPRAGEGSSASVSCSSMESLPGWTRTRAALQQLETGLSCSKCAHILQEPLCLGGCEHIFCRSCVGERLGIRCPVCDIPAWAKDVQINRQLNNIIHLFNSLQSLVNTQEKPSAVDEGVPLKNSPEKPKAKPKMKMWFSPRSRTMRCALGKKTPQEGQQQEKQTADFDSVERMSASVYEFFPSPPKLRSPKKKSRPKPKQPKKKPLVCINQEWGFGKKNAKKNKKEEEKESSEEPHTERVVSFCSQPEVFCSLEPSELEEATPALVEPEPVVHFVLGEDGMGSRSELVGTLTPLEESPENETPPTLLGVNQENQVEDSQSSICEKPCRTLKSKKGAKRLRQLPSFPSALSLKRTRKEEPGLDLLSTSRKVSDRKASSSPVSKPSPQPNPESLTSCSENETVAQTSPAAVIANGTPSKKGGSGGQNAKRSPSAQKSPRTPFSSPKSKMRADKMESPTGTQLSPGNPQHLKRNHKGETPLHIASIKGDVAAVEDLLKNGVDPNIKDNAGWTPLHEACNHGHVQIVELLLKHKALVNTTGYQNDSPLHDAIKNGHVDIVRLLLLHGASQEAVNIFGLRPIDYAETDGMKSVLQLSSAGCKSFSTQQPLAVGSSQRREGPVVLLGSGLSSSQRNELNKVVGLLKARKCTDFSSSVTHIVAPDDNILSTMKCMLGTLSGCWVLKFQWVTACLQKKARANEEDYELSPGARRGRFNRDQLLPQLFDGCYFYFLGSFKKHRKDDLIQLVRAGGGQVLARQPKPDSDVTQTVNTVAYHAEAGSDQCFCTQYILYEKSSGYRPKKTRVGKVWTAPSCWLIDCVTSFQLLPVCEL
uniref:BRCA1 associated RING domain 1 n=1 Tax=Latimeria chalumnae TaxID=7897 RepID=M3XHW8_LATCH|nr:PREDICTED: BRCA1-associated RING domain protein 1 isoform X2 [Latimeria chalumnae]|eukprot:XP_014344937.1 PREDICTED: BRCA1-associated RING domain protein 1 isoform X2 [Latimeria chalumnae]